METGGCRLCSSSDTTLIDVFGNSNDDTSLSIKISLCFGVNITEEDEISKKICKHCFYFSSTVYEHRVNSQKRDAFLKQKHEMLKNSSKNTNENSKPQVSKSISQDVFLSSLHLTSKSCSNLLDVHPTVTKILSNYPNISIPESCLRQNMFPTVILKPAQTEIGNEWTLSQNGIQNGQTSMVFIRVNNNTSREPNKNCELELESVPTSENSISRVTSENSISHVTSERKKSLYYTGTDRSKSKRSRKRSMLDISSDDEFPQEDESFALITTSDNQNRKKQKLSGPKSKQTRTKENAVVPEVTGAVEIEHSKPVQSLSNYNFSSRSNEINSCTSAGNLLTVGQEIVTFICQICNTVFDNVRLLNEHQKIIHKSLLCNVCAKYYDGVEELRQHNKDVHGRKCTVVVKKLTKMQILKFSKGAYEDLNDINRAIERSYTSENFAFIGNSNQNKTLSSEEIDSSSLLIMGSKSLLREALEPQILDKKLSASEIVQNAPTASTSSPELDRNMLPDENMDTLDNDQFCIAYGSDMEDDVLLVSDVERINTDSQAVYTIEGNNSDIEGALTADEHMFVNATFRKCRKTMLENRKNRKWILKNFSKLSARCIIQLDLQYSDEFNVKYKLKNSFDSKIKSATSTWNTASAIHTYRDDMPSNAQQVLTLEPFLTLHRDVINKPTTAIDRYSTTAPELVSVNGSTMTQTPLVTSLVAALTPLLTHAPVPAAMLPPPLTTTITTTTTTSSSSTTVTTAPKKRDLSKSATEEETCAAVKSILHGRKNDKIDNESADPENLIQTTTIFRNTLPVATDETVAETRQPEPNTIRNTVETPGSSTTPIVLNGLPYPIISNMRLVNGPPGIVQVHRSPTSVTSSSNTLLLVSPVPVTTQNTTQTTSAAPIHSDVDSVVNTSAPNDSPKPYLRIRNLSELTGQDDMNTSQNLHDMYSETLTKYVTNNPNSVVSTYKSSDEYLQIS